MRASNRAQLGFQFWQSVTGALLLAGCPVGPNFVRPPPPPVDHYTTGADPTTTVSADGQSQRFLPGADVPAEWWRLFKSAQLDAVMEEALRRNQSLQAAAASLSQSEDLLRAGYGVFLPAVNVGFSAIRQRFTPVRFGTNPTINTVFNLFTLSTTVSYALDVFGGYRRNLEILHAQVDQQNYTLAGTYLSLSGNLVNTVIAQAAYRAEIDATERYIELLKSQLLIMEAQANAGITAYTNVYSLRSQLAAAEATLPPLRQRLSQAEHLLATLAGHVPAGWNQPMANLADLNLPVDVPVSLPSALVRQRPDILQAEAVLHGNSAAIGVTTAALLPSVTLGAGAGLNNKTLSDLFSGDSLFWDFGPSITVPLFQGGSLWFQRKAAIDAYQASLANYRQTVLGAFAQVADTLRALENDAENLRAQNEQFDAATETLRLARVNYEAGTINYLQVLIYDVQYHQALIGRLQAKAQRLQDTVALYVALGGGWWNPTESLRNQVDYHAPKP